MPTRNALITGGSRGLGFALAKELLGRGWTVVLDAKNTDGELEIAESSLRKFGNVTCVPGDVADQQHLQALSGVVQSLGQLDAVVNNASALGPTPMPCLLDYPVRELAEVFRVNAIAPVAVLQAVRTRLKPGSVVINVTSDAGTEAYAGWGVYGASKAALEQISAVLAVENPELHIYWVDPGDMRTKMKQDSAPGEDLSELPAPDTVVPAFMRLIAGTLPNGRYAAADITGE
jgi:NAD(P)-dependent dehydrogenase (short-subunit alcohol dehydrogenase family)